MLSLTVKRGEFVKIGDDVFIYLNRIHEKNAQISFFAPDHVKIVRQSAQHKIGEKPFIPPTFVPHGDE